ncbi:hypothetical protein HYR82_03710 [Candidatus Peregrinibacteria bacterium]|nr:hypothetical protein [Candidatus Peregrinibacteria bacterium]
MGPENQPQSDELITPDAIANGLLFGFSSSPEAGPTTDVGDTISKTRAGASKTFSKKPSNPAPIAKHNPWRPPAAQKKRYAKPKAEAPKPKQAA